MGCSGEIWSRGFAAGIAAFVLVFLIIAIGLNNAPASDDFPLVNCSLLRTNNYLDPKWLRTSTNIYCGIFIGLIALIIAYHIVMSLMRSAEVSFIENKIMHWTDLILLNIYVGVFAAVAAGVVLLTSLRGNYLNTLGDQLNGFNTSHFGATGGLLWAAFGFSISSMYQNISVMGNRWTKCPKSGDKCPAKEEGTDIKSY